MQLSRALEQHIAVFGESGSGKTVLVSSFYGATQEPQFLKSSLFDVVADDTGQGHRLHRNYLGMRDSARLPRADPVLGHVLRVLGEAEGRERQGERRPSRSTPCASSGTTTPGSGSSRT